MRLLVTGGIGVLGRATIPLLLAHTLPSAVYNVCRDGDRVSNERLKRASGWRPER